jgi:hypothetical protein
VYITAPAAQTEQRRGDISRMWCDVGPCVALVGGDVGAAGRPAHVPQAPGAVTT